MKAYGGPLVDVGTYGQQTSDGGYIFAGTTKSATATGYFNAYLVKLDTKGDKEWEAAFEPSLYQVIYQVEEMSGGGFFAAGVRYNALTKLYEPLLVRLDTKGKVTWTNPPSPSDAGSWDVQQVETVAMRQTKDGGYVMTGAKAVWVANLRVLVVYAYLAKTGPDGVVQWESTFGEKGVNVGYSVEQTPDGGYIVAGKTESYGAGKSDMYLIKTDASGKEQWYRAFGGADVDTAYSVQQTSDGGYVLAGLSSSFGNYQDVYLVKTDDKGNEEWSNHFGGAGNDYASLVRQTSDGGFIIVGTVQPEGNDDILLLKTDGKGKQVWRRTFEKWGRDQGWWVQQTKDGGFYVVGTSGFLRGGNSDALVIKTNADGKVVAP